MYTLDVTAAAEGDLDRITDYIDEAAETVRVLRVFHSSEDYQRKL